MESGVFCGKLFRPYASLIYYVHRSRRSPTAATRIGEASHPGPNCGEKVPAKTMNITDGKKHLGDTFEDAYRDEPFRLAMMKKSKVDGESLKALQLFCRSKAAHKALKELIRGKSSHDPGETGAVCDIGRVG